MTKPFNWNDFEEVKDAPEVTAESSADTPSILEALGLGGLQGATFNLSDEIEAGARALPSLFSPEEKLLDEYYKLKSDIDERYKKAEEAHPDAYLGGEIGGTIGSLFIPGVGLANVGARGIKAAHTAYKATKGFKPAAKALSKVVGLSTAQGAGQGALQGAGSAESGKNVEESLENTLKGAGEGAGVGATLGLGLPIAGALGSGTVNTAKKWATVARDEYATSGRDFAKLFNMGRKGESIGEAAYGSALNDLESNMIKMAQTLKDAKTAASDKVSEALHKLKESDIKGEEFVNELQKIIDQAGPTEAGLLKPLSNELTKFKKITKVPDMQPAYDWEKKVLAQHPEAKFDEPIISDYKGTKYIDVNANIPRDPKVSQKVIQAEIPVDDALNVPELKVLKKLGQEELKTSALGKDFTFSTPEYVKSIDGRNYLQTVADDIKNLDPIQLKNNFKVIEKELVSIVDNITPDQAYNVHQVISNLPADAGTNLGELKKKLLNKIDNFIDANLSDEGRKQLTQGKLEYGNIATLLKEAKYLDDVATESKLVNKIDSENEIEDIFTQFERERKEAADAYRKGSAKDIAARTKARDAFAGATNKAKRQRELITSQIDRMPTDKTKEQLSNIAREVNEKAEKVRLLEELNIGSGLNPLNAAVGPGTVIAKKATHLAGRLQGATIDPITNKVSNFIQNHPKSFNFLQRVGKIASPGPRRALIQQMADQDPEFKQDLESSGFDFDNYEEIDSLTSADSAPERSPSGFNDAPERSISNIEEYEKILAHLDSAEGSSNNAPSSRVMIPGKTGLYDDGKGNPTTLFGANVNSPLTRQVYAKHGIDLRKPHKYPIELHEQAATDNWSEHNNQMVRSAKNLGLDFTKIPEEKLPPVNRLLTDMVFQRGPGILKKNKSMIDALNKGDIELFKRLYVNSEHFKAGNRGITLLPWLREL